MFTSSYKDTNYGIDPFTYSDQPRQFLNDILTSSSSSTTANPNHEDPPPFSNFFYLPSPLFPPYSRVLMDLDDQTLLLQEKHENGLNLHDEPTMTTFTCNDSISAREDHQQQLTAYHDLVRANEKVPLIGRRSFKRDRRSKINTAQGPRDRRMRLSLKVAREFFDVQDMLGFDKASKTVEWLLVQSKSSIEKLLAEVPGQMTMNYSCKSASSSLSECEVISGLDEAALVTGVSPKGSSKTSPSGKKKLRRTISSSEQKPAVLQPLGRAKARARARERALEKKCIRRLDESKLSEEATNCGLNPNQSGSCWSSAFVTGEEHSSSFKQTFNHNINPPPPPPSLDALREANARIHQKQERLEAATGCFIDDSLVIMSKWSPSSILTNHLQSTSNIPQELQIRDFQSVCKE